MYKSRIAAASPISDRHPAGGGHMQPTELFRASGIQTIVSSASLTEASVLSMDVHLQNDLMALVLVSTWSYIQRS